MGNSPAQDSFLRGQMRRGNRRRRVMGGLSHALFEKHLAAFRVRAALRKEREKAQARKRVTKRKKDQVPELLRLVRRSMKVWGVTE
jgi:hypothetical protein